MEQSVFYYIIFLVRSTNLRDRGILIASLCLRRPVYTLIPTLIPRGLLFYWGVTMLSPAYTQSSGYPKCYAQKELTAITRIGDKK